MSSSSSLTLPEASSSSSSSSSATVPKDIVWATKNVSRRNVAVWENCSGLGIIGQKCCVRMKIMPGIFTNGGIIVNYHTMTQAEYPNMESVWRDASRYFHVLANARSTALELWWYNGLSLVGPLVAVRPLAIAVNHWYKLCVAVRHSRKYVDGRPTIHATIQGLTVPSLTAEFSYTAPYTGRNSYGPNVGLWGIGSDKAYCRFADFSVEAL